MSCTVLWLILLIVFIVIELLTMGLTTFWFAIGSVAAAIASWLNAPFWLQFVLFLAVSLVLLIFTRPVAMKYFNKDREKTNAESLIGKNAVVTSEIDNIEGVGQVTVSGQVWSAYSADENKKIHPGTVVVIQKIHGVKLMVAEKGEEEK